MKITMRLGGGSKVEEVVGYIRWIGLITGEADDRLQGEDGKVYARRLPGGMWIYPRDGRVIMRLDITNG
jgi:hypothetical protein